MAVNNILHFQNYHTITLYAYDFNDSRMKIVPLTSLGFAPQESIKVKILDNDGLDIVRSGDDFISDVTLTSDLLKYCNNIAHAQYQQKLEILRNRYFMIERRPFLCVDYSSERYWALTSRLRGYDVSFIHNFSLDSQPFFVRPINRIRLKTLVAWCSDEAYVDQEEEEVDSAMETDEELEYSPRLKHGELSDGSDTGSVIHSHYANRRRYLSDPLIKAVSPLSRSFSSMLVVEYNEGRDSVSRHDIKQIGDTVVVELLDPYGACSCTIVMAGNVHASAWDLNMHGDEGAYDSGVNLYSHGGRHLGIILMGEQNGDTYNYATSLSDNIIVPDLAG